jgi:long-chain acyl-CoA synthetase
LRDILEARDPASPAIIQTENSNVVSYGDLVTRVQSIEDRLKRLADRSLVFIYSSNTTDAIAIYLACLTIRYPICLLEPTPANLRKLVEIYRPPILILPPEISPPLNYADSGNLPDTSYHVFLSTEEVKRSELPDAKLSLLLQTSGSTGDPKLVRLTQSNLLANARSIVQYLELTPMERSIQSLPIHYSYGLSLINSHLVSGGTVVLTPHSFMRPEFWSDFDANGCTSFAAVPYMYETLHRLRFDPSQRQSLRTMTQAGGALRSDLIEAFHNKALKAHCRFFVMYGQTEAAPRISFVPPDRLGEKIGSIGIPVPNGRMELVETERAGDVFELVYSGPNVMMGYAENASDLSLGDELNGVLHTGDLARVDDEGFYYLTGRLKRFAKLFGRRINLADIENELEAVYPVRAAAIDAGDHLTIFVESMGQVDPSGVELHLSKFLNTTPKAFTVKIIPAIPVTQTGKKDYKALSE